MENKQMIKQTKHGWVDLSNLPKTNNGRVDWKNSKGCVISFKYDDIISSCVINDVLHNGKINISINNYIDNYIMHYNNLSHGLLGYALQKLSTEFSFNIGDVINKSLLITSRYRKNGLRRYNYICISDGYIGSIIEGDAKRGNGCPACAGKVVIRGKTDVATTHPHIANLFWNKEEAYGCFAFSKKKVDFKCPRCGEKITNSIRVVTQFGLSCKKCGDGVSYPEKFVFNVLKQTLKLRSSVLYENDFETQKQFDWSKNVLHDNPKLSGNKIYDFYVPIHNGLLIETHGPQHFKKNLYHTRSKDKTLEEEQENDCIKYKIAIQNGISPENYVTLDCSCSTIQYIKQSIMRSVLPQILGFTEEQIDWLECDRFATSSRVYEACCYWNDGLNNYNEIASIMKMGVSTIRRYICKGRELNMIKTEDTTK